MPAPAVWTFWDETTPMKILRGWDRKFRD
jgi:hypothetical protein